MRKRETPLPTPPDRHPYIRATIYPGDEPIDVVFCREPSTPQLAAVAWFDRDDAIGYVQEFQVGSITSERLAILTRHCAGLAGAMWADPVFELEIPLEQRTAETTLGELWQAGWSEVEINTLGMVCLSAWRATQTLMSLVQARVNFTPPDPGVSNDSASGSPAKAETARHGGAGWIRRIKRIFSRTTASSINS